MTKHDEFELLFSTAREAANRTKTLLLAILVLTAFQLSNTLDAAWFDWMRTRTQTIIMISECLSYENSDDWSIRLRDNRSVKCSEIRGRLPFSFIVDYGGDFHGSLGNSPTIRDMYIEQAKSAIASYERSHFTQIPLLGISVQTNNIAIVLTLLLGFIMFILSLSLKSECRTIQMMVGVISEDKILKNARIHAIIDINAFMTKGIQGQLAWLLVFLPAALRFMDILSSIDEKDKSRSQGEASFVALYLGVHTEERYIFTLVVSWAILAGASLILYLRAFQVCRALRLLRRA